MAHLFVLASQDTSGSRAAAQVLLSAFNGRDYQLDITDLSLLDDTNYVYAIIVIRGRDEGWQSIYASKDSDDETLIDSL